MSIYSEASYRVQTRRQSESAVDDATPSEVAADVATHRKNYNLFMRVFLWSSLVSAAVFAALLIVIYWEAFW